MFRAHTYVRIMREYLNQSGYVTKQNGAPAINFALADHINSGRGSWRCGCHFLCDRILRSCRSINYVDYCDVKAALARVDDGCFEVSQK